jgi:hypothetical protein
MREPAQPTGRYKSLKKAANYYQHSSVDLKEGGSPLASIPPAASCSQ